MLKQVLHVGCGKPYRGSLPPVFESPEWREIRLDIDPAVEPDIIASMTDMNMVDDGSMTAIWSSHNLEHLHPHDVPVALAEFRRVLNADGYALIRVPDLALAAAWVVAGKALDAVYAVPAGPITPLDMIYGHSKSTARGDRHMHHLTGFTAQTLADALQRAGFGGTAKSIGHDLWALAHKGSAPPEDIISWRFWNRD